MIGWIYRQKNNYKNGIKFYLLLLKYYIFYYVNFNLIKEKKGKLKWKELLNYGLRLDIIINIVVERVF